MTSVSSVSIWKKGRYTVYLSSVSEDLTLCISHLGHGPLIIPTPRMGIDRKEDRAIPT